MEQTLRRLRIGDLVALRGKLVDVSDAEGRPIHVTRTSLTRDGAGSGACEILRVAAVELEPPG